MLSQDTVPAGASVRDRPADGRLQLDGRWTARTDSNGAFAFARVGVGEHRGAIEHHFVLSADAVDEG
mgnify:CR=1 FL=1